MDQVAAAAEAVAIAGIVASVLQERIFGKLLDGKAAFVASVLLSLIIGAVAVARVGGFAPVPIGTTNGDTFTVALEILKVTAAVLVASQAAFRVIVRPVTPAAQ